LFMKPMVKRIRETVVSLSNGSSELGDPDAFSKVASMFGDFCRTLKYPDVELARMAFAQKVNHPKGHLHGGLGDVWASQREEEMQSALSALETSLIRRLRGEVLLGGMESDLSQYSAAIGSRIMGTSPASFGQCGAVSIGAPSQPVADLAQGSGGTSPGDHNDIAAEAKPSAPRPSAGSSSSSSAAPAVPAVPKRSMIADAASVRAFSQPASDHAQSRGGTSPGDPNEITADAQPSIAQPSGGSSSSSSAAPAAPPAPKRLKIGSGLMDSLVTETLGWDELEGPPQVAAASGPDTLVKQLADLRRRISVRFDGHEDETHKIAAMVSYLIEARISNYMLSNLQRLALVLLVDGENWRAHKKQAFRYDNGAWKRVDGLFVSAPLKCIP
jgi:hypothetical protein